MENSNRDLVLLHGMEAKLDVKKSLLNITGLIISFPEKYTLSITFAGNTYAFEMEVPSAELSFSLTPTEFKYQIELHSNAVKPWPRVKVGLFLSSNPEKEIAKQELEVVDDTPLQLFVSKWTYNTSTQEMNAIGFTLGHKSDDRLELYVNGKLWGEARRRERKDVNKKFTWLADANVGWQLIQTFLMSEKVNELWGVVVLVRNGKRLISQHVKLEIVSSDRYTRLSKAPRIRWGAFPVAADGAPDVSAAARQMTRKGRKRLLESRAFHQLWSTPENSIGVSLRKAIVETMIRNQEINGDLLLRLHSGQVVSVNPTFDKVIARKFLLEGSYEKGTVGLLQKLTPKAGCFLDIGACYGHITMAVAKRVGLDGLAVAVEANPHMANIIKKHFALNRMRNVQLIETAVAEDFGEIEFHSMHQNNTGGSRMAADEACKTREDMGKLMSNLTVVSLDIENLGQPVLPDEDLSQLVETFIAKTRPLDDIVKKIGRTVDVMKMDIEGAELLALRGAPELLSGGLGTPPIIVLEYSNLFPTFGGKREDIFDILLANGYKPYKMKGGKTRGGDLVHIPCVELAPDHDDLVFVPENRCEDINVKLN